MGVDLNAAGPDEIPPVSVHALLHGQRGRGQQASERGVYARAWGSATANGLGGRGLGAPPGKREREERLDAAAFGRTAAVVGDGGDIPNEGDLEVFLLEGAQGSFATRARAFDVDGDGAHAVISGLASGVLGSHLSGKGGGLAGAFEAAGAARGPSDDVAGDVSDGDDGVVERRLDVRDASLNVLFDFLLGSALANGRCAGLCGFCGHKRCIPGGVCRGMDLAGGFLLLNDDAARAFASTGVGLGALAAGREGAAVAQAAVGAEVHKALDVQADDAAEVAFDLVLGVDDLADAAGFGFSEVVGANMCIDASFLKDLYGARAADTEDISECDVHALLAREVNACNTSHCGLPRWCCGEGGGLALTLFMARVVADDANNAFATDHFAFVADLFDRRADLHGELRRVRVLSER